MNEYFEIKRPSSDELIDLHVSIVPPEHWIQRLNYASQTVIAETFSVGFIRVHPDNTILSLRKDISEQIGDQLFPSNYVFLKHVGRCLALVREKQEDNLKAKNFISPGNILPELFILPSQPSTYNHLTLPSTQFPSLEQHSDFKREISSSISNRKEYRKETGDSNNENEKCPIIQPQPSKLNEKQQVDKIDRKKTKQQRISKGNQNKNFDILVHHNNAEYKSSKSRKNYGHDKVQGIPAATQSKVDFMNTRGKRLQKAELSMEPEVRKPRRIDSIISSQTSLENLGHKDNNRSEARNTPTIPRVKKSSSRTNFAQKSRSRDLEPISILDSVFHKESMNDVQDNNNITETVSFHKQIDSLKGADSELKTNRRNSVEEAPITIPSFAESSTRMEKVSKLPLTKKEGKTTKKKNTESSSQQKMWQDLQKARENRLSSQKKIQNLSRKVSKPSDQQQNMKKRVETPIKKKKPNAIFQPDVNNPGVKCPACYYVFNTQTDRKRHLALIHNIRISKVAPDDQNSKSWRAKVILKVSQERLSNAGIPSQITEKHKGDGQVGESMVKPINFYASDRRRRTRSRVGSTALPK
uniref:uncharacterized protein LOC120347603 n=1 Tax=Styela clava TaxID=7725 RepID=UPI00193AD534|nr:uncharacterized protein LOC120347603 [Styela clava]